MHIKDPLNIDDCKRLCFCYLSLHITQQTLLYNEMKNPLLQSNETTSELLLLHYEIDKLKTGIDGWKITFALESISSVANEYNFYFYPEIEWHATNEMLLL